MNPPTAALRLAARDRPPGNAVMRQTWDGLLFLHWPLDPEVIAAKLPAGLHVDTFGGRGWIGIVPFFMKRVRPAGLPPLPWLSWFLELNVRTYVHDDAGNPGVWFFSLECDQPMAVEIARRFFHLPYKHASMSAEIRDGRVIYQSVRKGSALGPACFDYHSAGGSAAPAVEGTLEWFLVERYLLFSADPGGCLYSGRVHHAPYRIAPGVCDAWSAVPMRLDGFEEPADPPVSALAALPVEVSVHPLRRC